MVKKVISKLSKSLLVYRRTLANKVQICLIRVILSDTEAFPGCLWVNPHNTQQATFVLALASGTLVPATPVADPEPEPCKAVLAQPRQPTGRVMGFRPPGVQRLSNPQQAV